MHMHVHIRAYARAHSCTFVHVHMHGMCTSTLGKKKVKFFSSKSLLLFFVVKFSVFIKKNFYLLTKILSNSVLKLE